MDKDEVTVETRGRGVLSLFYKKINIPSRRGISLVELLVVLVVSSVLVTGIFNLLGRQRRLSKVQRLRADIESVAQITFFIIGRDIRRAGSNPAGALGYDVGAGIPLAQAEPQKLEILADLDGDGAVTSGTDEDITYEFVDDPDSPDGVKDQIRRQSGNQLVIENVKNFDLCYQLNSSAWDCNPSDTALIRKVRVRLEVGTGLNDPETNEEKTKEIEMNILLRNFR
ncbi:MAG: prepilin-type N-terminal cleavage/methylation domain-containing protein [Bdellovibrionota bacterium]|nr:prepilin-type N-terminal cleavage/methylation domain-containing protein [Deltaproteobacteria bacterium]